LKVKLSKKQLLSLNNKRIDDFIYRTKQEVYTVNVLSKYETTSEKQKSLYWLMIDIIRKHCGMSKPDTHKYLRDRFLGEDIKIEKLDIHDFGDYIFKVKKTLEELGCSIEEEDIEEVYGNY
jgi:hypothetical protein